MFFAKDAAQAFKVRAGIILVISFITMYCSSMFGTDIINVIQNPIVEKLGCSATQAVLGWTVGGYAVIFIGFIFSTIIMKKGVRQLVTASFAIMAAGALLVGVGYNMDSVAVIAVGGFLLKNFLIALQVCVFQVVACWFLQTRGFILGLMGAAFALDNSTSSTGLTLLYNGLGFNGMMVVTAVILVVIGALSFIFVRTAPEELGLTIDGLEAEKPRGAAEEAHGSADAKWTFGKLFRIKESWCIMLTIGVFNMTLFAVVSQFFNSLMGMGVAQSNCMIYMAIFGMLGIVASPIFGKLVDKLEAQKTGVLSATLYCVAVAGFCIKIPVIAALGLTFFVGAPILQPALTMHVFGARQYQATNRYLSIGANLIGACGIPFMTICLDITGGYDVAYGILLALSTVTVVLMLICRKTYIED